ncbi:acyltransferase [Streptomyces sp. TM32]|uniref:acyltransferase family protein n=1 Tax=Streptomyces sp. TM32 TaxID=1652669 RepID=UPI0010111325|nr:acyltransferase [Streptomyces sp. TM32]RXS80262.1 acyltransferase [Streptomyces sp. TM32]
MSLAPAVPSAHRRPRPGRTPGRAHIAPLDGLRGLAVAAVLLFHAGYLGGGFLGVDLFFVLSGFLITGLLLGEAQKRGRIQLGAFWARRARRLLPALAVMGTAALLLAWAAGPPSLLGFALDDAPWAAAQAVNWHYIAEQVGYFNASDTRLFSHLWSIAVEWQFYLVWPLVVAVVGRGRGGAQRVAVLAGAGALASLALMIQLNDVVDTTRAYEGTDTRAFALLLGALAATAPVRRLAARVPGPVADGACALLVCGLVASWVLTGGQNAPGLFQGGLFAHSLAAAVLIALLAAAPGGYAGRALGSAVPRRLGELSYSLYLWHWPIYLLLPQEVFGIGGWARAALAIGLSLVAAVLSKLLVEDPVRFRARWATGRRGLVALLAAVVVAVGVWTVIPRPQPGAGTVDVNQLMSP